MLIIMMEPTEEMYDAPINGQKIPVRIWIGKTDKGTEVEVLVLSIIPEAEDLEQFKTELPDFMKLSRKTYAIADWPKEE